MYHLYYNRHLHFIDQITEAQKFHSSTTMNLPQLAVHRWWSQDLNLGSQDLNLGSQDLGRCWVSLFNWLESRIFRGQKTEGEDGEYKRGTYEREIWRYRRKGKSIRQEIPCDNQWYNRPSLMRRALPERAVRNSRPAVPPANRLNHRSWRVSGN